MDGASPAMADRAPSFVDSPLLPLLLISLASQKHSPDTKFYFSKEYDYIVVGAGSGGATVAARLSEMPCISVLLLEAGPAPPILTEVPAFDDSLLGPETHWDYRTVPQKYTAQGFTEQQIPTPRAKMLGGCSSHNYNEYVRGNRRDYDGWAAGGADGWSYEEVLPYFKKMEDSVDPELVADGYHGVGGPLTVTKSSYVTEITEPLFEAHRELGLKEVEDHNGQTQTGSYVLQETIRDGQRCSTAKAYLLPKENAHNLNILINALVTKVLIEEGRATGVRFDLKGRSWDVRARREVILSAGALNTPQLLMLSGIGPAGHLRDLGIPVIVDLPVGLNLHDHPSMDIPFELDNDIERTESKLTNDKYMKEYINHRSGPLSASYRQVMGSFADIPLSNDVKDFPSFQFYFEETSSRLLRGAFIPEIYHQVLAPYENKTLATCYPLQLRPKTRGSIRLQSSDPYDLPVIDYQYLEDPEDFDAMVEAMKFCHRIILSQAMRRVGARPLATLYPGCEALKRDEEGYFRCVVRLIVSTGQHFVGTAKMGDPRDSTTVVDPQLRVKNIVGLRVVDASVMPAIPTGNTNAPTIMIAEKAADMIKQTITCW